MAVTDQPLKLVFMGTPDFAAIALDALVEAGHDIVCVYTQPPRPAGRGKQPRPGPVHRRAQDFGLQVRTPASLKDEMAQAEFAALGADVAVVAAYGLILPAPVLDAPRLGCLNIHASLLPRWRGAAPIQRAILAGDKVTGVAVQRIVLALDEGDVLLVRETPIGARETSGELFARLAELGGEAAVAALDQLAAGEAVFTPQPDEGVTYAKKLAKRDGRIDWSRTSAELDRFVRAMTPWPGARTGLPDGRELVVLEVNVVAQADAAPLSGTLAAAGDALRVTTGDGALDLLRVQPQGKKPMEGRAFLRGARLEPGVRLGADDAP